MPTGDIDQARLAECHAMARHIAYLLASESTQSSFADTPAYPEGHVYSRESLKSVLQLLGCKQRHACKLSESVFEKLEQEVWSQAGRRRSRALWRLHPNLRGSGFWVSMPRGSFNRMAVEHLLVCGHKGRIVEDWKTATSLIERRRSVIVLLCGTSGTGKSTLASLLASRLGITTIISTDSIRQMMQSFSTPEENPLLFASTYQAGDSFDDEKTVGLEGISDNKRALKGYKAQCEMVMEHLERLVADCENRRESMVCEGVHLSLNFVVRMMKKHPSIIPFLIFISNETKHRERFAVRSKYMMTDPTRNRYVKHMKNIRIIQDYLTRKADKHFIPKVNNTNVDRSVAIIHSTIFGCIKQMMKGTKMLDVVSNTVKAVNSDFAAAKESMNWRGKDVLEVLRSRNSCDSAIPSTSNAMISEDNTSSDSPYAGNDYSERVMSSDPDDEPGSDWENSSYDGCAIGAGHSTDYGSVLDSTDFDQEE